MTEINKYLNKHLVKDHGYCKEYDNLKACVIGSFLGLVYYKEDTYYYKGLDGNTYSRTTDKPLIDIPLFKPNTTI